ncbi:hypothetical protein DV738_g131, partial [Chaetothyriales sp. CBS 135597]
MKLRRFLTFGTLINQVVQECSQQNREYDAKCYLCPGNTRASGDTNPHYKHTFVFVNDYSAVKETQADYTSPEDEGSLASVLLQAEPVKGRCYVLAFSAAHNVTLADMSIEEILVIVKTWTQIYRLHLSPDSALLRIWTTTSLPEEAAIELGQLKAYHRQHGGHHHLLVDYAKLEQERGERVVFQNETFLVVCPWWATWPFEVMILPTRHVRSLVDLSEQEQAKLAEAISEVTRRYDNLFETSFPYSMGIHQAPLAGSEEEVECSSLHLHFYPPLLRSATVRKFLVGYEMLGEPQRDITPEQAAVRLRACGGELYRKKLHGQAAAQESNKAALSTGHEAH